MNNQLLNPDASVSKHEFFSFKQELMTEIRSLFSAFNLPVVLKSAEVKKILKCSDSKLDTLRKNGTLKFTYLDGTYYYKLSDVNSLFEDA